MYSSVFLMPPKDQTEVPTTFRTTNQAVISSLSCRHREGSSEIECVNLKDGKKEIIAQTFSISQLSAKDVAECLSQSVNQNEQLKKLVAEMLIVFGVCLDSGCLSWSLEQDVEEVCLAARQRF
jgi:hypothetical protein